MAKKQDKTREDRIENEIVVDAHSPQERATGWYSYLEDTLAFSFTAHCTGTRAISPLQKGDEVEVIGMAPAAKCQQEMFVAIRWKRRVAIAGPLSQLEPGGDCDAATRQAFEDWLYWVKMGYEF